MRAYTLMFVNALVGGFDLRFETGLAAELGRRFVHGPAERVTLLLPPSHGNGLDSCARLAAADLSGDAKIAGESAKIRQCVDLQQQSRLQVPLEGRPKPPFSIAEIEPVAS